MHIRLLGPVEFSAGDGTLIEVSAPKRRALLTLLALEADQIVTTARLITAVWGEQPPATARAALQGHIAALRKQLPEGLSLVTHPGGYALNTSDGSVDVRRFDQLRTDANRTADPEAVRLLRAALDLWRGEALANCGSEELRARLAPALEDARLSALEEFADRLLRLGRGREALGELRAATERHPLRESLTAALMLCLEQDGSQDEALTAYDTYAAQLAAHRLGLFRGLLSGRRILLILDNVSSSEQVLPLLCGDPAEVAVIVTGHHRLHGLVAPENADE